MSPSLHLTLRSPSMEPTVAVGESVITKPSSNIRVGDIIAIPKGDIYTVHRFVASFAPLLPTWGLERGDAEKYARLISTTRVAGKVVFPDLAPSPSHRSELSEIGWWICKLTKKVISRTLKEQR